ncbi:hypothetical protein CH76_01855 [Lysinibacillus sp. BF-4]|uniref:ArpU family phage packaging/lysis transcriptional regulator n=1 Tax=Lysinibacillus sp. BF-4 TaxID=1473546 RepID=UPI000501ACF7|nr:ArpU family phage packaging/lysis transcriptional regulator [Lysinibacillus sp. BF-4]KFL44574.1 hypothetical protein CH76_01855 [Lysinibacillus sp. BF-4]
MRTSNQLAFGIESPYLDAADKLFTTEELDRILANQQKYFMSFAELWLKQYHQMKRVATTLAVPSITSSWSDVTSHVTGVNESNVERYALKKITAQEWLATLHKALAELPGDFQQLIELKYLKRRGDGQCYADDYVYDSLCLSRSAYYKIKPIALDELGRTLHALTQT